MLTFSGPVNAAEADETSIYHLATPGKKGSYTAKNAGTIKLKSATDPGAGEIVTLTPKRPFALTKPVQLSVSATGISGLHDTYGRLIDGDDNGRAGGNAIALLMKKGATIDGVNVARTAVRTNRATIAIAASSDRIGGPLEVVRSISWNARQMVPPNAHVAENRDMRAAIAGQLARTRS